jgi:hypothetical protein
MESMRARINETINLRLANSLGFSATVTLGLVVTSGVIESRLGVPQYWPWLLTSLQVLSLWAAGGRRWWGWLLGASVQPPWIAYAILTGQWGFIPGCAISAAVQTYSYLRKPGETAPQVATETQIAPHRPRQGRSPIDVSAYGASLSVPTM